MLYAVLPPRFVLFIVHPQQSLFSYRVCKGDAWCPQYVLIPFCFPSWCISLKPCSYNLIGLPLKNKQKTKQTPKKKTQTISDPHTPHGLSALHVHPALLLLHSVLPCITLVPVGQFHFYSLHRFLVRMSANLTSMSSFHI